MIGQNLEDKHFKVDFLSLKMLFEKNCYHNLSQRYRIFYYIKIFNQFYKILYVDG